MKSSTIITLLVIALIIVGVAWLLMAPRVEGEYDEFATCLAEEGATFYGTWWCPHCQTQKDMFGASFDLVNYVECSPATDRSQLPICQEAGIEGYPTWKFASGEAQTGVMTFEELAERTGCELPQEVTE